MKKESHVIIKKEQRLPLPLLVRVQVYILIIGQIALVIREFSPVLQRLKIMPLPLYLIILHMIKQDM